MNRSIALSLAATCSLMINSVHADPLKGAIFTTTPDGSVVNANVQYTDKREVYLDGGPPPNAPQKAAGLPDDLYVFQITNPSGAVLLSMDPTKCRVVEVKDDVIIKLVPPSELPPEYGSHADTYNPAAPLTRGGPKATASVPPSLRLIPNHPTIARGPSIEMKLSPDNAIFALKFCDTAEVLSTSAVYLPNNADPIAPTISPVTAAS
jgi:hypothetical protein